MTVENSSSTERIKLSIRTEVRIADLLLKRLKKTTKEPTRKQREGNLRDTDKLRCLEVSPL